MIEVHVFNSMLMPSLKQTGWFQVLNYVNGLVAPAFLFVSGFAFMLSTKNDTAELRKFGSRFWKKLGRITLVFLAGYSLHLPILSLRRMINYYSYDVILRFYNVDILQCIAAGLLILLVLKLIIKSNQTYNRIIFALIFIVIFLSPAAYSINWGKFLPVPFAAYLNNNYGSFFPLFPWLAFLFAGAVTSYFYLNAREKNNEKKFVLNLSIAGLAFTVLGKFFLSGIFPVSFQMIRPHPAFVILRLGLVLLLLGVCWYYSDFRDTKRSFVLDVGRESLLVYWLHLQIIYRIFWNGNSVVSLVNQSFSITEAIIFTLLLAAIMVPVARLWGNFKKKYREITAKFTLALVSLCVIIFLIGF